MSLPRRRSTRKRIFDDICSSFSFISLIKCTNVTGGKYRELRSVRGGLSCVPDVSCNVASISNSKRWTHTAAGKFRHFLTQARQDIDFLECDRDLSWLPTYVTADEKCVCLGSISPIDTGHGRAYPSVMGAHGVRNSILTRQKAPDRPTKTSSIICVLSLLGTVCYYRSEVCSTTRSSVETQQSPTIGDRET